MSEEKNAPYIRLGISACLLGEKVRYDGGHKIDRYLKDTLGMYVEWVPVCPEVEYGLPVPRESLRLVGDPASPRMVTTRTNIDHTEGMLRWASKRAAELGKESLCGFVFKSKSPSSGMQGVKVYGDGGSVSKKGVGMFARAFMSKHPVLPVEDEGRLNDASLRENFIERVFVYSRWLDYLKSDSSKAGLVDFHTAHKLLIMAHSPKHYSLLGKLVAEQKKHSPEKLKIEYISALMDGLKLIATIKKNTNVLQHIAGYFKDKLSAAEKAELQDLINNYHKGLIPLIVPVTLLNHYVRKYDDAYLKRQVYLHPHPLELMLRNHV
ncbi:MAG: DUF523 and DUF1722 domain-containing protein [Nitrospiraceae bacterium]|nr:DUF523 and DUF1722 domain-containing protein [Nitrospiraceae bacterium]